MITWLVFLFFIMFQGQQQPPVANAPRDGNANDNGAAVLPDNQPEKLDSEPDDPAVPDADKTEGDGLGPDPTDETQPSTDPRLYTLGSLDPDSPYRYLVTINPVGGTIRRVELNFRQAGNKSFKYRDLENISGYLGCLDCIDTPEGCLIRTVGHGTPAYYAKSPSVEGGIQPGDIIAAVNGEPMVSANDFESWLEKTKAGSKAELTIRRKIGGSDDAQPETISFSVDLIRKPIELLRPESNEFLPNAEFPESFLLSLLRPMPVHDSVWPELDELATSARWELRELSENEIEVRYALKRQSLAKMGYEPLTLVKRYRLPKVSAEELYKLNSRTFHFNLELEIVNSGAQPQKVAYELDGPTGSTLETWWYAHKIHGRSTALFSSAGARDVIGSTEYESFIFFGCPEIADGAAAARPFPQYISSPHVNSPKARQLRFVGVDTQYFNVSLLPQIEPGQSFDVNSVTAFPSGPISPQKKYHRLADCTFQLFKTVEIPAGESYRQTFDIFAGPKDSKVLDHYGLDDTRTFGWFSWLSKPLMWLLHFFYWITGGFSYGIAIVMLTVLVRSLMIPISRKAAINAQMMQALQPQMQEIREKYKDTPEKQGIATRDLFRKYKYNPLSGCFLGLLQLPIFLGLFRGLSVDIALRDQPLIPGMAWCNNLSGPDQFLNWSSWMPAFLSDKLGFFGPYLNILPLVTVVLFLVQQKMFMPPATDDQQRLMQKIMTFMMIFMGFLFFKVAAGLCVYFITSSTWGILERKLLPKPELNLEKFNSGDSSVTGSQKKTSSEGGFLAKLNAMANKSAQPSKDQQISATDRKQRNADRKKRLKNLEQ
jgi:YidC/Oxa1 family membrane protein insertase